jgi:hypothetical protein
MRAERICTVGPRVTRKNKEDLLRKAQLEDATFSTVAPTAQRSTYSRPTRPRPSWRPRDRTASIFSTPTHRGTTNSTKCSAGGVAGVHGATRWRTSYASRRHRSEQYRAGALAPRFARIAFPQCRAFAVPRDLRGVLDGRRRLVRRSSPYVRTVGSPCAPRCLLLSTRRSS